MHRIVFLDRATLAPGVRLRRPAFEHRWSEFAHTDPADVVQRLDGATMVIDNKVPLRRDTLERLPDLQLVAVAATGTDCVDKDYCRERGIVVSNVRNYAVHTVPEHVFALILALRRSLCAYRDEVRRGAWQAARQFCFFAHPIEDLHGSNLGIIGEGSLGQGVAQLARAFGMNVMFAAHKGKSGLGPLYTPFDEVLETADVITLHCPLLPETRSRCSGCRSFAACAAGRCWSMRRAAAWSSRRTSSGRSTRGSSPARPSTSRCPSRRRRTARSCGSPRGPTSSSRRTSPGQAHRRNRRSPTS